MPEAIASNYKGIIEAIKEKSGNGDLSYPSNFYGIVNALVDAIGFDAPAGNGVIPLPPGSELPGSGIDGDLVVMPNADGNYFLYVRVDDKWHRIHVTTQEVETAGSAPAARRTRVINRYKPIAKKNRLGDPGALTISKTLTTICLMSLRVQIMQPKMSLKKYGMLLMLCQLLLQRKGLRMLTKETCGLTAKSTDCSCLFLRW